MNSHSTDIVQPEKQIILQPFSQRLNAWPHDDWSGIADSSQRRKLQNRVNQRARRKLCFLLCGWLFMDDSYLRMQQAYGIRGRHCQQLAVIATLPLASRNVHQRDCPH